MAETFKSGRPRGPRLSAEGREPSSAQQCPAAPSSHRQTSALPQTAHFPAGLHPKPQPLPLLYHIVQTASESTGTAAVPPAAPQGARPQGAACPLRCRGGQAAEQDTAIPLRSSAPRVSGHTNLTRCSPGKRTFLQLDLPAVRCPQPGREAERG